MAAGRGAARPGERAGLSGRVPAVAHLAARGPGVSQSEGRGGAAASASERASAAPPGGGGGSVSGPDPSSRLPLPALPARLSRGRGETPPGPGPGPRGACPLPPPAPPPPSSPSRGLNVARRPAGAAARWRVGSAPLPLSAHAASPVRRQPSSSPPPPRLRKRFPPLPGPERGGLRGGAGVVGRRAAARPGSRLAGAGGGGGPGALADGVSPADLSLLQEDLQEEIDGCEWSRGAAARGGFRARKWLQRGAPTVHCGRRGGGGRRKRRRRPPPPPCSALPCVHDPHAGVRGAGRAPPGFPAGERRRRAAGCVGRREARAGRGLR